MKAVGVMKLQLPPGAGRVCAGSGDSSGSVNYLCANRLASKVTRLLIAQSLLVFEFNDCTVLNASQRQFVLVSASSKPLLKKCVTITAGLFSAN